MLTVFLYHLFTLLPSPFDCFEAIAALTKYTNTTTKHTEKINKNTCMMQCTAIQKSCNEYFSTITVCALTPLNE